MAVNINMRAVGGDDGEFREDGWCFIALVKSVYQVGYQPGGFALAGCNFPFQVIKFTSLAMESIQGMLKALLPFLKASL